MSTQLSKTHRDRQAAHQADYSRTQDLLDEIKAYQVRNEAMLNSLGEGLIATDHEGTISQVNSCALEILGFGEDELLGQWFPEALVAVDQHGQKLNPLRRSVVRALTENKAISESTYYLRRDGSLVPVSVTVSPIMVMGRPIGAIEVFRDLTAERKLDIAKDEFVSLASHQLKTPATGIKSILSMLLGGDFGALTPLQYKYVDKAIQANDRQLQIVEDLLNVAQVDASQMALHRVPTDLVGLTKEVLSEYRQRLTQMAQTHTFIAPRETTAYVDPPKMRMVIDNLVSNASKYTPAGGHLEIRLRESEHAICLSVEDNGVGVAAEHIEKIFSKFGRVPNEFSTSAGGTGLGLYLARKIVALHNGQVTVDSVLGKGTVIQVIIPTTSADQGNRHDANSVEVR